VSAARWHATAQEEIAMSQSARSLEQAFAAQQARVLDVVADYRFFVPARLAADDRLAAALAHHALVRDAPPVPDRSHGPARRWCGARLVRLGAWLGGTGVPAHGPTIAPQRGTTVGG
jgi:hypothetical protein